MSQSLVLRRQAQQESIQAYRASLRERQEAMQQAVRDRVAMARVMRQEALLGRPVGFPGAEQAIQRVEIRDPDRSSLLTGLALGLGIVAVLGVTGVLVYLLVKKDGTVVQVQAPTSAQPGLGEALPPINERVFPLESLPDLRSVAARILEAGPARYLKVQARGPAGEWAILGYRAQDINDVTGSIPTENTHVVFCGETQVRPVRSGFDLLAKGSSRGVKVAVSSP